MTDTAQIVTQTTQTATMGGVPIWAALVLALTHLGSFVAGLFTGKKPGSAAEVEQDVEKVAGEAVKLAPIAEQAAALAGQPAVAAGIIAGAQATQQALQTVQAIHAEAQATAQVAAGK